jgi:hypothetical protein
MICKIFITSGETPRILHRAKRRAYYIGRNVAVERRASSSSLVK